jgi:hypothetical protein
MLSVIPLFHANLQYAEFHPDMTGAIVERSYLPALAFFAAHPALPAVFEFSGITLELLADGWPQAIDDLRRLLARGQIELLGSSYANPILPLIPTDHARRHLQRHLDIYDRLFGDLAVPRPRGLFLQEFAYDPALAPLICEAGYRYTILTPELLLAGLHGNLNRAAQQGPQPPPSLASHAQELLHPVLMRGAGGAELAAFPFYRGLIGLLFDHAHGRKPFAEVAAVLQAAAAFTAERPALLICGPSDAEFVGALELIGQESLTIEQVGDFMSRLAELPGLKLQLPRDYLDFHPPARAVYVPAGSSERVLDLWTADPDNARLNALCAEADQKLRLAEALYPEQQEQLAAAWDALLLAENSDGRGWKPCPERRLACYNQALRAIALAESMLASRRALPALQPGAKSLLAPVERRP